MLVIVGTVYVVREWLEYEQETGSLCPFAFLFQEALVTLTARRRVKYILAGVSIVCMVFLKT